MKQTVKMGNLRDMVVAKLDDQDIIITAEARGVFLYDTHHFKCLGGVPTTSAVRSVAYLPIDEEQGVVALGLSTGTLEAHRIRTDSHNKPTLTQILTLRG